METRAKKDPKVSCRSSDLQSILEYVNRHKYITIASGRFDDLPNGDEIMGREKMELWYNQNESESSEKRSRAAMTRNMKRVRLNRERKIGDELKNSTKVNGGLFTGVQLLETVKKPVNVCDVPKVHIHAKTVVPVNSNHFEGRVDMEDSFRLRSIAKWKRKIN
ncbi:hypothetical protein LguiB_021398 [Lonicera macranthoides]